MPATAPAPVESLPVGQRRFLSIESAAAYVDLSAKSIRRLISAGKLKPLRPVRGKIVIDRIALEQLVATSDAHPRNSRGQNS